MAHKTQEIVLTFDDGGVGIMHFILDPRLPVGTNLPGLRNLGAPRREATDEAIEHEIAKTVFHDRKVVSWRRIASEEVPTDRTYRNAWKDDGKVIGHDMAKAKNLHRDILRNQRVPLMAALDVEYQKADEADDRNKKRDVSARRQKLRDAPSDPRIEAARTVEDLKAITIQ